MRTSKSYRRERLAVLLFTACLSIAALPPAAAQRAAAGLRTTPAPSAENRPSNVEIDSYLMEAVEQTRIPGLVAMVADADSVLYAGAFGQQNVAEQVPMSVDTIFRIASMTKPVTSVAVVMLIEEGKVGLDDPISKYLPELAGLQVIDE